MKFNIEFASPEELNLALDALAQLPYGRVAPLLEKMVTQARAQERAAQAATAEQVTEVPKGTGA